MTVRNLTRVVLVYIVLDIMIGSRLSIYAALPLRRFDKPVSLIFKPFSGFVELYGLHRHQIKLSSSTASFKVLKSSLSLIDAPLCKPSLSRSEAKAKSFSNRAYEHTQTLHETKALHGVKLIGEKPYPAPVSSFESLSIEESLRDALTESFPGPTPIQAVTWPIALAGRDVVGVAQTGSGKTLSYVLPAIVHLRKKKQGHEVDRNSGTHGGGFRATDISHSAGLGHSVSSSMPTVLIVAPTRELVVQIHESVRKYTYHNDNPRIFSTVVYGGVPRQYQIHQLRRGTDIVIGTPGRLIDLVNSDILKLSSVSYLVLDEADRMLDMGFISQIRDILVHVPPERQTLLYSATWPKTIQSLADDIVLSNRVKVQIGSNSLQANPNIKQLFTVCDSYNKRDLFFDFLKQKFPHQETNDAAPGHTGKKLLVFVDTKKECSSLGYQLQRNGMRCLVLHGGKEQKERDFILHEYKNNRCNILLATDVASRGLDITDIDTVINYDTPKTPEDYIHRIGRTARAANLGESMTFVNTHTPNVHKIVKKLIQIMDDVKQVAPDELHDIIRTFSSSNEIKRNSNYNYQFKDHSTRFNRYEEAWD